MFNDTLGSSCEPGFTWHSEAGKAAVGFLFTLLSYMDIVLSSRTQDLNLNGMVVGI